MLTVSKKSSFFNLANDNESCELINKKDTLNMTLENATDPHDEFLDTPRHRVTPRIKEMPIKRTPRKVNNNASKKLFEESTNTLTI